MARLSTKDSCTIDVEFINDKIKHLALTFKGGVAVIPSTSNTKAIYTNKQGRPFLGKNHRHKARLNEMRDAYFIGLLERGLTPQRVSFGSELVHVMVLASGLNNRTDSHNLSKGLCDWLEEAGIIDNDKSAQCWCARASDYEGTDINSTVVVIKPFIDVATFCARAILDLTKMQGFRL